MDMNIFISMRKYIFGHRKRERVEFNYFDRQLNDCSWKNGCLGRIFKRLNINKKNLLFKD